MGHFKSEYGAVSHHLKKRYKKSKNKAITLSAFPGFDFTPRRGRLRPLPKRVRFYFKQMSKNAAIRHGIDPNLFAAQITQESGADPRRISGAGAVGIAQIVPRYHPNANAWDPRKALDYAARHMAGLVKQYGNYEQALSVYNSGRPNAYKNPRFAGGETYTYVRSIKALSAKQTPARRKKKNLPPTPTQIALN